MNSSEVIQTFTCGEAHLIGIVHQPAQPRSQGLLCVIAGGPQYRIGCCRQQVTLARKLAAAGIPVMRFDYRGMGDSEGEDPGLERGPDIDAAIAQFKKALPGLQEIVLYGGCDGASAIAMSGWNNPDVSAWVLNNPYTEGEAAQAQVMLKHYYLERLLSRDFWRKLARFEFDIGKSAGSLFATLKRARSTQQPGSREKDALDPSIPFTQRMLEGWRRFRGDVLLLIASRSLVAKEFDQCVAASAAWQAVVHRPNVQRVELTDADHTFSEPGSQEALHAALIAWFDKRS